MQESVCAQALKLPVPVELAHMHMHTAGAISAAVLSIATPKISLIISICNNYGLLSIVVVSTFYKTLTNQATDMEKGEQGN